MLYGLKTISFILWVITHYYNQIFPDSASGSLLEVLIFDKSLWFFEQFFVFWWVKMFQANFSRHLSLPHSWNQLFLLKA